MKVKDPNLPYDSLISKEQKNSCKGHCHEANCKQSGAGFERISSSPFPYLLDVHFQFIGMSVCLSR